MNRLWESVNSLRESVNRFHECVSTRGLRNSISESPLTLYERAVSEITSTWEWPTWRLFRTRVAALSGCAAILAPRVLTRRASRGVRLTAARVGLESPTYVFALRAFVAGAMASRRLGSRASRRSGGAPASQALRRATANPPHTGTWRRRRDSSGGTSCGSCGG